jgi:two-component system, response regulator
MSMVQILLVEDSLTDGELCIHALRKRNLANEMAWAKTGEEALDLLLSPKSSIARLKVILLDLGLPGISGIDVLRAVKSDPRTKSIPVVVLSGWQDQAAFNEVQALGVASYLVNPGSYEEYSEMVARLGVYWTMFNRTSLSS